MIRHGGCLSLNCMKAFREYTRVFLVYMSFAVFLAAEVAVIYFVYKYLGVI
jgi:hypothetical protein